MSQQKLRNMVTSLGSPPRYVTASLIVALGGLLNGLDTGTIGPVTSMPSFNKTFGDVSPAMLGWVVSSLLLSATVSSLFAGTISDSLGRTRSIAIGSLVFAIGATLECASVNLAMLIAGRIIVGAGEGLFLSTLLVYVCEIAPPRYRSTLATTVQMMITLGLVLGFFTCYGTTNISSSLSFRLPFALQASIAIFIALAAQFYLPASPRWLASHGRHTEADLAWDVLGVSAAEREKDSLQTQAPEISIPPEAPTLQRSWFHELVSQIRLRMQALSKSFRGDARKPMLLAFFFMTMQQLSGIDGILYYAPLLFSNAGLASNATFLASGVSAIMIFVSTIIATAFAHKWGRRPSTIYGGLVLLVCMVLMGMMYATDSVHATYGAGRWIVIPSLYIFACTYSMTWAIGLKLYASEIQPTKTRASAMALSQAGNTLTNFFVAFITPILLAASSSGAYWMFGGSVLITVLVSVAFMPETKSLDLESIGQALKDHRLGDASAFKKIQALRNMITRKFTHDQRHGAAAGISSAIELQPRELAT